MKLILREYQVQGVENLRHAYRKGKKAPLYVLPTGGGKTAVFSFIAEASQARGRRALILVHRHELLMQASRSLTGLGVGHGIISPKFFQTNHVVQIASVQTLVRRLSKIQAPDLIIVDEAHHSISPTYRKILAAFPKAHVLGVTATPCRSDGAGLNEVFDEIIIGPSIGELIKQGYLVGPVVYAPPIGINLEGVHRRMGDYDKRELEDRIDKPTITGDAVEHYLRLAKGEPGIAFCVSVAHAENVAEEFRSRGVRALRVDGAMDDSSRKAAIEGLENGSLDILTSADLIGEGVDIPRVTVAILLRPTQSLSLYIQQCGRALRPYPGKTRALILDHVGNVITHGFPDESREWSLDGIDKNKKNKAERLLVHITQCQECFYVYETDPSGCPECGAVISKPRQIEVTEGELKELTRESVEAARREKRQQQARAKTLEDLITLGKQRGYKNPAFWAEKVYSSRGGKSK